MESFLKRSTYLHRGLPILLGWLLPIGSALWLNATAKPSWQDAGTAVLFLAFLAWFLGLILRPFVTWGQVRLQSLRP